jgi:hypothetical protein
MTAPIPDPRVLIEVCDGKLILTGQKECITPEIVDGLRAHKTELLHYLTRFGAQGIVVAEGGSGPGALQGVKYSQASSYIKEPDNSDNLTVSGCGPTAYDCQVSVSNPTTPDNSAPKPDKGQPPRRQPYDPRLACIFRNTLPVQPEAKPVACVATLQQNVQVELRRDNPSRWSMWITESNLRARRKDFATPFLDHAKRTAEHWYGAPINGWHEPEVGR